MDSKQRTKVDEPMLENCREQNTHEWKKTMPVIRRKTNLGKIREKKVQHNRKYNVTVAAVHMF
jgi:hypothetical protein